MKLSEHLERWRRKLPSFRKTTPGSRLRPKGRTLRATAARRGSQPAYDDYEEEDGEPTTRLSAAFIVVLVLHLVAIGGIFAFHSLKVHRRNQEAMAGPRVAPAETAPAPVKPVPTQEAADDKKFLTAATPTPLPRTAPASVSTINGTRVHHVLAGETLTKIAGQHNVSVADLASANGLKETTPLRAGQNLNLPAGKGAGAKPAAKTAAAASPRPGATAAATPDAKRLAFLATQKKEGAAATGRTYTVGKGDSPAGIARKLGVSVEELMKVNNIDDPKKLQPNQVLKVPAKD